MDGIPGVEGRAAIQRDFLEESISRNVTTECHQVNPDPGMGPLLHPYGLGQPSWGAALLGRKVLGLWASSKLSMSQQPGLAAGMASTSQAV